MALVVADAPPPQLFIHEEYRFTRLHSLRLVLFNLGLGFSFLGVLFFSFPALCCGMLEKAEPKVGSNVSSVHTITLHFTEPLDPAKSHVELKDPHNKTIPLVIKTTAHDTDLSFDISLTNAGTYTVMWHAFWPDCHTSSQGDYSFHITPDAKQLF